AGDPRLLMLLRGFPDARSHRGYTDLGLRQLRRKAVRDGRIVRSLNVALLELTDRIVGPENRIRRAMSPFYSSLLDVLSGGRGYPVEINGQVFRIDPRFRWGAWPGYEREVARYLAQAIKPGQTCFDVGANVGVYVLQLGRWSAPDGQI